MIGSLRGTIHTHGQNPILVEVGGVGYAVSVGPGLLSRLKTGTTVGLLTHTHVRDDAIELFGFETENEHRLFELLLDVSGIGPKTALLITDRGVAPVARAVTESDVAFFTTIPRLGRKNAQKIIIELKNRFGSTSDLDLSGTAAGETAEITDALLSMGFEKQEIHSALKHVVADDVTPEQKIRRALKFLGKR
ncbi:Holliday junction branch migration protein RuvA [Patescibacteria group bacterium]|nr:Holliday junction branch migration protein RuvA [Patescibacteria group bacterium]